MIKLNPIKALCNAKIKKLAELKSKCNEACSSYEYQGNIFALDAKAIENVTMKDSCPIDMDNRYRFFAKELNKPKIVDFINKTGFRQFKEALFMRKDWIMVHYNQLYAEIKSCKTPQQVEDIMIDFSEPKK